MRLLACALSMFGGDNGTVVVRRPHGGRTITCHYLPHLCDLTNHMQVFEHFQNLVLNLCYVYTMFPGGHGSHVSGHRGQNGMDVRGRETTWGDGMGEPRGTVTGRDCRGCRARFLNCQKICHWQSRCAWGNVVGRSKTGVNARKTWQYVRGRNKTWRPVRSGTGSMTAYRPGSIRARCVLLRSDTVRAVWEGGNRPQSRARQLYIFLFAVQIGVMVCIKPVAKIFKTCLRRAD